MDLARRWLLVTAFQTALALSCAAGPWCGRAAADPVHGFVEHWDPGTLSGWTGGDTYSNPGTGGVRGAGDGFMQLSTPGPSPVFVLNLGANSASPEYTGNWLAAGIDRVQFWLEDVGQANPLEIHFALGSVDNFWQYDTGFVPPAGHWAPFVVDLTGGPGGWTQIISSATPPGTFGDALQNVQKVLIRHDRAPFTQNPDTISADVGVDELALLGATDAGVPPGAPPVPRAVALAPPYPNPSSSAVTLAFESFDGSPIHVEIVDASGRLVRHEVLPAGPGHHLWMWDGDSDAGPPAAPGAYRARAYDGAGGGSRPLIWLGRTR